MPTDQLDYDVVIVGGRPAGASLAMRLGRRGQRVLLVDRAIFPSPPAVPSSPVLYQSGMAILDELGVPEADYARTGQVMERFCFDFAGRFTTVIPVPEMWGRDYVYGLDRARFDEVLWRSVGRFPSVTQRAGFAVDDLLRDEQGQVVGVIGSERGGPAETIRARCVVGADGRFSLVARKAKAVITEQETAALSTVYFADWEGVGHYFPDIEGAALYVTGQGLDILFFRMPEGRTSINTHARADRVVIDGDAQAYYRATLFGIPAIAERLAGAEQVGSVVGVKRIGNGYRQASGPGWVLVGDAVHYKDPADGQGIHDALLGARLLDAALAPFLAGERSWTAAMAEYRRELHAATHPMYEQTLARLRRELYDEPPPLIIDTLIRWTMTDPIYQQRFMHYLGRIIPATGWNSGRVIAGAVARGIWRDLRRRGPPAKVQARV